MVIFASAIYFFLLLLMQSHTTVNQKALKSSLVLLTLVLSLQVRNMKHILIAETKLSSVISTRFVCTFLLKIQWMFSKRQMQIFA